jgi:GDP-4-dehydro-6-deoxy-D-mannose reductase
VVHLAGIAFSPDASASPIRAFEVNALGAFRLLTRLAMTGASATRVLIVGSAEQYGAHPDSEQPLGESAAQAPLTVYAASKATQEVIALQMARAGQHVVCTRSFNHAGVGQNDRFLFPALVARAKGLPRGGAMALGNSAPVRDYLHVADVVAAYDVLLERGVPGQAYNVCSGIRVTIREIAERVLRRLGVAAEITTDATLVRDVDVPVLVGDNAKLRSATGWAPRFSIDDIIDDVIHGTTR